MLKKLKEYSKLKKVIDNLFSDEIVDVIIFGSAVKDKISPNDIDIAVIFRTDIKREILSNFQKELGERYHISSLLIDQFFNKPHSLAKTLLLEGISLVTGKRLSDNFDLTSSVLYTYDISKEKPSKKVRWVYLLKGRGENEGIVHKFKGTYISNSSFIMPIEKDEEMIELFKQWDIKFYRKKLLLMS
ncbi:MAG: nucleotidyltransferase domain-containing protein [Nanoarchaeota archaeon]|nr:nucleotidyltransferase domain-containing protein [Nanoarchaeota archaeon]MBU1005653.1 nucleotidyltransferase domain-containing protein [Nanoarchaeota archaeon]MBU1946922.1 nucleotidyltransferase domain-containing protein [Nanoarchaeota archaeon]